MRHKVIHNAKGRLYIRGDGNVTFELNEPVREVYHVRDGEGWRAVECETSVYCIGRSFVDHRHWDVRFVADRREHVVASNCSTWLNAWQSIVYWMLRD